jgi:DNA (cytosine-5)-methyltransferase 1
VKRRPILLDLFCKAGGAAEGYHRAGFEIVGIDIEPQPRYPYSFIQMDALTVDLGAGVMGHPIAAVHASPPCQTHTRAQHLRTAQGKGTTKKNLVPETRTIPPAYTEFLGKQIIRQWS